MSKIKLYSYDNIPKFTRASPYSVNVSWRYLEKHLDMHLNEDPKLDIDPDFQRGHVWNEEKQKHYIEFILRGGRSSRDLLLNCPGWGNRLDHCGPYVLVDGKQRLEAVRKFLRGDLAIFDNGLLGNKKPLSIKNFDGHPSMTDASFIWNVNDLETRAEVLQWYLELNSGGVVHTEDELEKVRKLLKNEK